MVLTLSSGMWHTARRHISENVSLCYRYAPHDWPHIRQWSLKIIL